MSIIKTKSKKPMIEKLKQKALDLFDKKNKRTELGKNIEYLINHQKELDKTWVDNIWQTLSFPERAVEIEGWLSKETNKGKAFVLRGKAKKETMLHWGVLSTLSLTVALLECNLNINEKDIDGKTPFDWLMERYNVALVSNDVVLDKNGKSRLKAETQGTGVYIWQLGARPSKKIEEIKRGDDMILLTNIANGELWLVKLLYNTYGETALKGWLKDQRSMIHIWSLSPKSPNKKKGFEILMSDLKLRENILKNQEDQQVLSIDEKDINGRTALWYTVDALKQDGVDSDLFINNAKILLKLNANPLENDLNGISPYSLVAEDQENDAMGILKVLFDNHLENKS